MSVGRATLWAWHARDNAAIDNVLRMRTEDVLAATLDFAQRELVVGAPVDGGTHSPKLS